MDTSMIIGFSVCILYLICFGVFASAYSDLLEKINRYLKMVKLGHYDETRTRKQIVKIKGIIKRYKYYTYIAMALIFIAHIVVLYRLYNNQLFYLFALATIISFIGITEIFVWMKGKGVIIEKKKKFLKTDP